MWKELLHVLVELHPASAELFVGVRLLYLLVLVEVFLLVLFLGAGWLSKWILGLLGCC